MIAAPAPSPKSTATSLPLVDLSISLVCASAPTTNIVLTFLF